MLKHPHLTGGKMRLFDTQNVAKLARKYLSLCVTSVAAEPTLFQTEGLSENGKS